MLYWSLKVVVLGPLLRLLFRPWVEGAEHVPEDGPAIFASNHLSFSDSIFLPLVVGRRLTFPAKSDYFTGRGIKGRLTALFFRGVGQIPIDRSGGRASLAALEAGKKLLAQGELFGIYPEGTRSPDGRLYRGKTGVARLALETGAPVIPVAMIDTHVVQPPGKVVPHIGRIGVRIGKPLDFSRYEGMSRDRYILRSVTDEIMYEILALSGQEYVDVYADRMKQQIAEAKAAAKAEAKAEGKVDGRAEGKAEAQDVTRFDASAEAASAVASAAEARALAATRRDDAVDPLADDLVVADEPEPGLEPAPSREEAAT